jgi:CRISPR-associated protein Csm3
MLPYIPGSSLKGKIRCLLETEGDIENGIFNDDINTFFGQTPDFISHKNKALKQRNEKGETVTENFESPTRIIFRDLFLDEDWEKKYKLGEIGTEIKTEIAIDRTKGSVKNNALRTIERVPPGTKFNGEILIRYSTNEELDKIENILEKGFELLNNDYLGGSGSRGYGAVNLVYNIK